jgi:uncharacterized protein
VRPGGDDPTDAEGRRPAEPVPAAGGPGVQEHPATGAGWPAPGPAAWPGPAHYPATPPPQGPFPHTAPNRHPAAPPRRTHRWGLGAYVIVEALFLGTSLVIALALFADGTVPQAWPLVIALAVPTVLAAGTAILITRLRGNGPRADLGLLWSWRDLGLGLAFGFGGLALTIPASVAYVLIVGEDASTSVGDLFGGVQVGVAAAVAIFLIVVLVAPLCEEIVYRGLLWGGVEKLGGGRWVAFGVTTVLFAIAHLEFLRTPLLLVVAIPIALARVYTGRLLASIVAHQVNNLLPGVVLLLALLGVIPWA